MKPHGHMVAETGGVKNVAVDASAAAHRPPPFNHYQWKSAQPDVAEKCGIVLPQPRRSIANRARRAVVKRRRVKPSQGWSNLVKVKKFFPPHYPIGPTWNTHRGGALPLNSQQSA